MARFAWLKKKSELVASAAQAPESHGQAERPHYGKGAAPMDVDGTNSRRDSLSNFSDDSAFAYDPPVPSARRDTSSSAGPSVHAQAAAGSAATAAQHARVQQQQQQQRLAAVVTAAAQRSGGPDDRANPAAAAMQQARAADAQMHTAPARTGGAAPQQPQHAQHAQQQQQQNSRFAKGSVEATGPAEPLQAHPHFQKIRELNRGTHGFVQLAVDTRTGMQMAIKFIPRDQKMQTKSVLRELVNQRLCLTHPYIITLHEVFLTKDHLGIAMEYADGGDLTQFVCNYVTHLGSPLPEHIARQLFQQLIIAVDYCHRLGIVNRDIKLDNMLLHNAGNSEMLKLCDFGYSKDDGLGTEASGCKTACGTPEYMAPEVMLGRVYDGRMVDVWSIGCSLFVMLAGAFPFLQATQENLTPVERMRVMFPRLVAGTYNPLPGHVSHAAADLIARMLQPNPSLRITVAGIMQHPWFLKDIQPDMLELNDRLLVTSPRTAARRGAIATARRGQEAVAASGIRGQTLEQLVALVESCITTREK